MRCVIVDIDGTLADNKHRVHHLDKKPKDWDTYDSLMHLDTPVSKLIELLEVLCEGYSIVLCSGRKETHRKITEDWLYHHDVIFNELYMRKASDPRPDAIVKAELLEQIQAAGYEPQFVIDDRNSVVAMWRSKGLLCLQVAPGDF